MKNLARKGLTLMTDSSIADVAPQLEITECEILHDFLGVMENIMEELPFHEPKLKPLFSSLQESHEQLRGVDARFCAIDFAKFAIEEHLDGNICKIAQRIMEICQISYSYIFQRTLRQVLHFLNLTFLVGFLLVDLVGPTPKKSLPVAFTVYTSTAWLS